MKPASVQRRRARGVTSIEFALSLPVFLLFMLGLLELARAMYLWNALSDATRGVARGASMVNPADAGAMAALSARASMAVRAVGMSLGTTGLDGKIVVAHLRGDLSPVSALPACPSRNIINCNANPNGANCVRYVQARLCAPGSGAECTPARYRPIFSGKYLDWSFAYPTFATVTPAGSLGHQSGVTEACPAF